MRTRGKRVTAETVIKRDILIQNMRAEPESLAFDPAAKHRCHFRCPPLGRLLEVIRLCLSVSMPLPSAHRILS